MRRPKYRLVPPKPTPKQPTWTGDEPCRAAPEVFHPESADNRAAQIARWLCGRCPMSVECLEWALADPTLLGIHAGTTKVQRAKIRSDR